MGARLIIAEELLARDILTASAATRYADGIIAALRASGFRLLAPGEVQAVQWAFNELLELGTEPGDSDAMRHMDALAAALRDMKE